MARRRLGPARPLDASTTPARPAGAAGAAGPAGPAGLAPIARVAGETAAEAALRELSDALSAAREEERLLADLPLGEIDPGFLARDRIGLQDEEMAALIESIRAHGQRSPIEVQPLQGAEKPWGLISGWRRLVALSRLHAETGEDRFATIRALIRHDRGAEAAYLAMVEENEIRAGLSHYERARIAALTAERGVFANTREAVARLFAAGSRARRSKILSFLTIHNHLGDLLTFPAHIPERLGLRLAEALKEGEMAALMRRALAGTPRATPADELALIERVLAMPAPGARRAPHAALLPRPDTAGEEIRPGLRLKLKPGRGRLVFELSGPALDTAMRERLEAAVRAALRQG
ncbi:MAG: nuclease [Alphaproteobacteria bacterium]|nr:MAG: nuclease [Alphaproteobacteria bacterium]